LRREVHWIVLPAGARLAIMARPRAGEWLDDEIVGWRVEGIDVIVSLLEAEEGAELGLHREVGLCQGLAIEFISFPIPDRGVPRSASATMALAKTIVQRLSDGKAVAIHCRAGIGRSALIAACVLELLGIAAELAFVLIGEARGVKVLDTEGQRNWVGSFRETAASNLHEIRSMTAMSNASREISPITTKTRTPRRPGQPDPAPD
jgi:hypothetical protein